MLEEVRNDVGTNQIICLQVEVEMSLSLTKKQKKLIKHNEHEEKTENNCLTNTPRYRERE
jgi:hypothetical protein